MQTIKDYLKQTGYTQKRMANKLGVSVMAVNSLLTGRRKFGVKTATAWSKAFGSNPVYLMTGDGEMLATEQPAPAAAALGHGSHTVTDIYIRRDASKVDEALRQVASKLPASYRPLKATKDH